MKIRIKGNSVRIRLSKSEVKQLAETGRVDDRTQFVGGSFCYALQADAGIETLRATYQNDCMTMYVPQHFSSVWYSNDIITIDAQMPLSGDTSLYLLLEKDFKCLDHSNEDQSDNYDNPNKTC
jgi:hypothetical protein